MAAGGRATLTIAVPADPRTRQMKIVTEAPFARFYAGVPLKTAAAQRIGTICIMDTKPRPGLTLDETLSLEALARQTVMQLELRKTILEAG